jgi:hypothetical protein
MVLRIVKTITTKDCSNHLSFANIVRGTLVIGIKDKIKNAIGIAKVFL